MTRSGGCRHDADPDVILPEGSMAKWRGVYSVPFRFGDEGVDSMGGHIQQRGRDEDGKPIYRVFISGGHDGKGKRVRKSVTVHGTPREAEQVRKQLEREMDDIGLTASTKLADWVESWLKDADKSRAPRTMAEYRRLLTTRILPALGHIRLDQLRSRHIFEFMGKLAGVKHARHTEMTITKHSQRKYYCLLSVIFQDAVYSGLLASNPVQQVRPPRIENHRARFYEPQDVEQLWQALQTEPLMWRAIIATGLLLGIRRGELMGLRWGDINWERNAICIERAAYRVSRQQQQVKAPKTATSKRSIPMPEPLVTVLKAWQVEQKGAPGDYICADARHRWLHIDAPTKWFEKFIARHKLPPLNLHGLRHTAATIMLEAGIPVKTVSEHLGHGQTSTTTNIYAHTTQASRERAAEALSDAVTHDKPKE